MPLASLCQLILLSAIWGSSFLFMRVAVPSLGPAWLIEARVLSAALLLLGVALWLRRALAFGQHWRHYLVLGGLNTALPFLLFAFAAQTLSASLLSILNATSPIWAALVGRAWLGTRLTGRTSLGLGLGVVGVALLLGLDPSLFHAEAAIAIAAALAAPLCYAIASNYAQQQKQAQQQNPGRRQPGQGLSAFNNAHGSMWAGALLLLPLLPFAPIQATPTPAILTMVLVLGVLCTGIAYLLYFKLIDDVGAASALTVTFLVPVFGVLWGTLFLDEPLGWHTLAGTGVVILGTALVTGFSPRQLWRR